MDIGNKQYSVGEDRNLIVSCSTVLRCIHNVTDILYTHMNDFIKFPSELTKISSTMEDFLCIAGTLIFIDKLLCLLIFTFMNGSFFVYHVYLLHYNNFEVSILNFDIYIYSRFSTSDRCNRWVPCTFNTSFW